MPIYQLDGVKPDLGGSSNPSDKCWVAPTAIIIGDVALHEDANIWFGAVLRGDNECITVGKNSNIQEMAMMHTDMGFPLIVGEGCTIGHKAILHGCTIGDNSLIGIGATLLNHVVIGESCLIGAHSLVTEGKSFEDKSMVVGAPAKRIRELSEPQIEMLKMSANIYVANGQRFKSDLKAV